ncbi:tripartite tricarboxylate transporter substrate binding protein [Caenimonas terrae]|uniref:Tripartite tricarboxylate transporter substrate binding protein n=1 Tax=Caenimonas terrae TaxID=696074 RepID=A0ABW0NLP0_9BURK
MARSLIAFALAAAALAAAVSPAVAEVAGGKPVVLVVSYPVGGGADLMARLIAPRMAEALGQTVLVDNKPGGAGQLAGAYVAKAAPDGATLLLDASSFAVTPALYPRMSYDPTKAFTPIAVLALFPNVLVAYPQFPPADVQGVLAAARAAPGKVAFASSGNGSAQHLAGALFEDIGKVSLLHVPYRGGGPAMTDVMGGQVPLFFANLASSLPQIQNKRLRPMAVTSRTRSPALPNVPTMEEAGLKGYEVYEWNPVLAPAGISADTRRQLVAAVQRAMAAPEVQERIRTLGGEAFTGGPDAAAKFLKDQRELWSGIVRERNIKAE